MIQVANLADSFAAIKQLVYDEGKVMQGRLLKVFRQTIKTMKSLEQCFLTKFQNTEMT